MLFVFKKFVGAWLMPLPFGLLCLLLALWFYFRGNTRRAGGITASVLALWLLFSFLPFARWVISPLEYAWPKYHNQTVDFVVVLGGYHQTDKRTPISNLLAQTSLMRLAEGIRILRLNPGSKLIVSGYAANDPISQAEAAKRVAMMLGVDENRIITEPKPRDTGEEARLIAPRLNNKRFALVTSASHMPRAVRLFQAQGLKPVPAPTAYTVQGNLNRRWQNYLPKAGAINMVTMAWHEYLGLAWMELRGI